MLWGFYIYSQSGGTEVSERLTTLKEEISELDRQERELDQHKLWVQQSIKNVTDEVTNTRYTVYRTVCCYKVIQCKSCGEQHLYIQT